MNFERIIINSLFNNNYFRKVFQHLKETHFENNNIKRIFKEIQYFFKEYQKIPTKDEINIFLQNKHIQNIKALQEVLEYNPKFELHVLLQETEKFLKNQELKKAIIESVEIIENNKDIDVINSKISDALKINMNTDLGTDIDDIDKKYDYYSTSETGLSTGVKNLDFALDGLKPKTLSIIAGGSHSGKSSFMIGVASENLVQGKNVLYISLEMTELEIGKRVDANLLNIPSHLLKKLSKEQYTKKIQAVKKGKMFIKEFGAGTFSVLDLESLLSEYENIGTKFDLVVVDYLGIMKSVRLQPSSGLYEYYKSITEELHSFTKTTKTVLLTAIQLNRSSYNAKTVGMENVSDSIGIAYTADVIIGLVNDPKATEAYQDTLSGNRIMKFQILKNRNTGELKTIPFIADFSRCQFRHLTPEFLEGTVPQVSEKQNYTPKNIMFNKLEKFGSF